MFASEPHYLRHMLPVWKKLPEEYRGDFMCLDKVRPYAEMVGLETSGHRHNSQRAMLNASYKDFTLCRRHGYKVLMEHGIGQTYEDYSGYYAGGPYRELVDLFLCPNIQTKLANEQVYLDIPAEVVGTPSMDYWHRLVDSSHPAKVEREGGFTISFHWQPKSGVPEMGSAVTHYSRIFSDIQSYFGNVSGHGHPRIEDQLRRIYGVSGIPWRNYSDVLRTTEVYICDNSSTMYEFASLDLPVVVLNAPWMRRDVNQGLRFWDFADVGIQVDEPEQLALAIEVAMIDPPEVQERRREITDWLYPYRGYAADKAAKVLVKYLEQW